MRYFIRWDAGYGESCIEFDAKNEGDAADMAYECWLDEAEDNAEFGCVGIDELLQTGE